MPLLSIIIPAYNEERTIEEVVRRMETSTLPLDFTRELIVINDGSKDRTGEILKQFESAHQVLHVANTGKGGAVRKGFALAKGDFIIVKDADLEQDPEDIPAMLRPIITGRADVVFGSRFLGSYKPLSILMNAHYLANLFFTHASSIIMGYGTTDVWTGYKMYSRKALDAVFPHLRSDGIEFELEVAVLLGKFKLKVVDVPISYVPRWYDEGKKTDWKQGLTSLRKLIGFSFRKVT